MGQMPRSTERISSYYYYDHQFIITVINEEIYLYNTSDVMMAVLVMHGMLIVSGPCLDDLQFPCGDNTCINRSLVCNNYVNCNHMRDEAKCASVTAGK